MGNHQTSRRGALKVLAAVGLGGYVIPAVITVSDAKAKDGASHGGGGSRHGGGGHGTHGQTHGQTRGRGQTHGQGGDGRRRRRRG